MRVIPRALAALAVASAFTVVASPGAAQEDTVAVPRAEAQATAVRVSLFGNELILSDAGSAASSAPSATADGTGARLATTAFGESSATADSSTPTAGSETPTCSDLSLPPEVPLLDITAACSASVATAAEGAGSGTSGAEAFRISVSAAGFPIDLGEVTDPIVDPILDLLGQAPLPAGQLDALEAALDLILDGAVSVISIESGTTEATSTASSTAASATSSAEGLTIEILDGLVATITVGRSVATATYEGGQLSAEHVVAPITIALGAPVLAALGLDSLPPIPVPPGQTVDLPLPAPLTSSIVVADGEDEITDTTARSSAANVRLDLATGLPGGGVVLAAADAAAAVERPAEEPAEIVPPAEPPAVSPVATPPAREALPRTGGDGRWVSIGVLLAVGASVSVLALRRLRPRPA